MANSWVNSYVVAATPKILAWVQTANNPYYNIDGRLLANVLTDCANGIGVSGFSGRYSKDAISHVSEAIMAWAKGVNTDPMVLQALHSIVAEADREVSAVNFCGTN